MSRTLPRGFTQRARGIHPGRRLAGVFLPAGGTAAFTGADGGGSQACALVVDTQDLDALASAAESLAASQPPSEHAPAAAGSVGALLGELAQRGVTVRILDAGPDGEGAVA